MNNNKKTYWKGLPQLTNDSLFIKDAHNEFNENNTTETPEHSRRDFLKMMGFSLTAAVVAACEAPVRKAIPFAIKPIDADPGIPNYYASTYVNAGDACSVVVKVKDGRPIKVDGNALSSVTKGGTSAQIEASVLSLYDDYRLRQPKLKGDDANWETVDQEIISHLADIAAKGQQIRIVSNTISSPGTLGVIAQFLAKYPTAKHIQYDPISAFGIVKGNEFSFGKPFIPSYDFSKAKVIVSIAADFIGGWLSPIESSRQYAATRGMSDEKPQMSRHYQFESLLSITGANADYRTPIKPSQEGVAVAKLYNMIAAQAGQPTVSVGANAEIPRLEQAAKELWENRGASLVVAGANDPDLQTLVNAINTMLGNYGVTILPEKENLFRQGNDMEMDAFVNELLQKNIGGVIFYNCNPVYDHLRGTDIAKGLADVQLSVSTAYTPEETASVVTYMAPDHHYLESWNDVEICTGHFSFSQPTITPLFKTRQAQESLLKWAGVETPDYFNVLKENWRKKIEVDGENLIDYQSVWDRLLFNGVYEKAPAPMVYNFVGNTASAAAKIASVQPSEALEIVIYESTAIGNGSQANNPLLQEMPDPITKSVWDHYVTLSQADAKIFGVTNDAEGETQMVSISGNGKIFVLPALIQPGQKSGVVGMALGYGRTKAGIVAEGIGANAYQMLGYNGQCIDYRLTKGVTLNKNRESFQLAQTQMHNTYMGRTNVVQETTLKEFIARPNAFKEDAAKITKWDEKVEPETISLWKGHDYKDHHWAMAIDLNTCTGCSACIVSCNVENNVALVGKQEVINRREMHWLRIDRYYSSPEGIEDYAGMEKAAENPEVVFQPMLCQHCNNAPCETVCPVAATTHSSEGLNQMTYNRCIGTRYCANNCPYKVRRFNWFKYHTNRQFLRSNPAMNSDLGRMVLNPDVTVRSRGVMEKCSFCVQRIQEAKLTAKREKRPIKDGDVVSACQSACSSGAIVFGDINDENSRISKLLKIEKNKDRPFGIDKKANNPRAYRALEEIGVKPNIFYLTKVRNKETNDRNA